MQSPLDDCARADTLIKVILIADTQSLNRHHRIVLPRGDLLIHAGDFCTPEREMWVVEETAQWLAESPIANKFVIGGNHDALLNTHLSEARRIFKNHGIDYINCGERCACGLRVFGVSYYRHAKFDWGSLPTDLDILITHAPPWGILDWDDNTGHKNIGDTKLLKAVMAKRPRLHLFGHSHTPHGLWRGEHTLFVNGALSTSGVPLNAPISVWMNRRLD